MEGLIDCNTSSLIEDNSHNRKLVKSVDLLGREVNNSNFSIKIYNDGSVDKSCIIDF